MDQEEAVEDYDYGPLRIAAKKRVSDASIRQSLDRRLSSESSSTPSTTKSPRVSGPKTLFSPNAGLSILAKAAAAATDIPVSSSTTFTSPFTSPKVPQVSQSIMHHLQQTEMPSNKRSPITATAPSGIPQKSPIAANVNFGNMFASPISTVSQEFGLMSPAISSYDDLSKSAITSPHPFTRNINWEQNDPSKLAINDVIQSFASEKTPKQLPPISFVPATATPIVSAAAPTITQIPSPATAGPAYPKSAVQGIPTTIVPQIQSIPNMLQQKTPPTATAVTAAVASAIIPPESR
uniref:Uncharacterized protein n=1 Tax=Panagrolaimus davidi TaxID=227884 RepID=A0A914QTY6_9BILA